MTIGEALRQERKQRGLSQSKFVNKVLSVGQYSRIEHGEQDIGTSDLVKILLDNKINVLNFFSKIIPSFDNTSEEFVLNELAQAFYDKDLYKAEKLKNKIESISSDSSLILRATLIVNILKSGSQKIDEALRKQFSEEINKSENWTEDKIFLQLLGSSMQIFDMNRLNIYMTAILNKYKRNINSYSFEIQRRIAGICINYLNRCRIEDNSILVSPTLSLINKLSQNPDLLMYKLLGNYFKYLFNGDEKHKESILEVLRDAGYNNFLENLPD